MKAYCLIREAPWYRRSAFIRGLQAAGNRVMAGEPKECDSDTLLLTWNRYGHAHTLANRVEAAGGTVLVAENGYLGVGGSTPKWDVWPEGGTGSHYFALAVGGHNGSGHWHDGGGWARWDLLGIDLKPWKQAGEYELILGSRPFGRPDMVQPSGWADTLASTLAAQGKRTYMRTHPGNDKPAIPVHTLFERAAGCHVWASSAGLHAMIAGVPTRHYAPHWIGAGPTREEALRRLSWAQWTIDEIQTGEPFHLLCGISTPADTAIA